MPTTRCGWDDVPGGATGSLLLARNGPSMLVDIGFDPSYVPGSDAVPVPGTTGLWALVDTGATDSCIDAILATELNLPVVDRRPIGGIGGTHIANMYLAQIHVPSLSITQYGVFAGVNLAAGGQMHRALIGRSFLQHYTMLYLGTTGTVQISRPDPPSPAQPLIPGLLPPLSLPPSP